MIRRLAVAFTAVATLMAAAAGTALPAAATGAWTPATWLAVAGSDSQMWVATAPAAYTPFGGGLRGAPAVVTSSGKPYYIGVGTNNALYVRTDADPWALLAPSDCIYRPAAALQAGMLTVMCTAPDSSIWYGQTLLPASGLPFMSLSPLTGFANAGGGITVVNGTLTFFVPGLDSYVYLRTLNSSWTKTAWRVKGSVTAATGGTVAYVGMHGTDGHLYVGTSVSGGPWSTLFAGGMMLAGPGVAAYSDGTARIFVEGTNYAVYDTLVTSSAASGAFMFDGGTVKGGVGAAA